jgi:hypothetical protein
VVANAAALAAVSAFLATAASRPLTGTCDPTAFGHQ